MKVVAEYISRPSTKTISPSNRILIIMTRREHPKLAAAYEDALLGAAWVNGRLPLVKRIGELLEPIRRTVQAGLAAAIMDASKGVALLTGGDVQPTHTAVNKDDPSRPRFALARELAFEASSLIAPKVVMAWQTGSPQELADILQLVGQLTEHPQTGPPGPKWWHAVVDDFMRRKGTPGGT